MPRKTKEPSGFQPIEYTPGEQNRPIVSELPKAPAAKPVKAQTAPAPKPLAAAEQKKEN